MTVKPVNNKKTWENFILGSGQASFLQSWNWGEFNQSLGHPIHRLGWYDKNKLQAVTLIIKKQAKRGTYLECPAGPITAQPEPDILADFITQIKQTAQLENVSFLRIRPNLPASPQNASLFKSLGFIQAPMHLHAETTWVLDITKPEDQLLAQMRKSTRYSIKKALKMGVKVTQTTNPKDIGLLYQLQLEAVKRHHFVPFSQDYLLKQLFSFKPDNQIQLFKASYQNKLLAVSFIIFYGSEATYHYSGSSNQLRHVPASYLLQWQAILEAKQRGLKTYNFWGIAKTDNPKHRFAGVTLFKKGFGGCQVDYLPAHDLPLKPNYWLTYGFETLRKHYNLTIFMALLLGLLIFSFVITSISLVPFINLLYRLRFTRKQQTTKDAFEKPTPIFDRLHAHKKGTPVGGGFLVISVVTLLFFLLFPLAKYLGVFVTNVYPIKEEIHIIFFTFISFALLGLYDDIMKFFNFKQSGFFGLRLRHKFLIQWVLALIIASLLCINLKIDILYIPFFKVIKLGWLFIPFAAAVIVAFANAVNITDGLDGLASGVLMIALFAFWLLSASILDTPLSFFLALWLGSLIAFLYFNVFPARIWLGDVGALAFGATFAVVGLLLGKVMALLIIGAVFVVEFLSSLIQLISKHIRKKKVFPVAPFHLWLQLIGWEEPKIVARAYLATIMLAVFGLWLALI